MKIPPPGIHRIIPKKIWHQIFCILILFVMIPLVILGGLLLQTSQNAIRTTILRDHKELVIHATGEIREHVKGSREALVAVASILGTLHTDLWGQETAIVSLSLRNTAFQRIASVNLQGAEMVTSELGTMLQNRTREDVFQKAVQGVSSMSEVKISRNHIPFVTIAEPIRQFGKVKGVLIADLNLRSMWDIVDGIKIGRFGRAYLIDHQGRIIAHPDKKLVLRNSNLMRDQIMRDIVSGQVGNTEEIDRTGEAWLTSYAPISKFKWGLIITQPESEAFAFSKKMKMQFLILIALSILATGIISFFLAYYIRQPVRNILEGARRIAKGDFSHPFRIRRKNEMDKLLFSFNQMMHKLSKAQADEKLSIIGRASTEIAHELKNSLQLIDTFIKLLPQRQGDKKFIKELSDTVPRELDAWNESLCNMMDYSKKVQFPMKKLNVNDMIKDVLLLVKLKARQVGVHCEEHLEDNIPMIMGNKEKLKQVVLNIVTNALEATTHDGHISITTKSVDFSEENNSRRIEIEVANSGERINKENLNKIFEPFYTTKSGGLGLGLSISREIINHHHGSIKAKNGLGKKISFIVQLPTSQETPQQFNSQDMTKGLCSDSHLGSRTE